MNEVDNTLKAGLITATTDTAIEILNQTFPRTERSLVRTRRRVYSQHVSDRGLVRLGSQAKTLESRDSRNLVYYTDDFPVTIDRIIDVTDNCPEGNNCLLIISTITVVLEGGDDADAVKRALVDGVTESFNTGSFYEKIPADTVICPERRKRQSLGIEVFGVWKT
jgi:phenylpyruvate tautomerase PptA (4-oxalocrotonate tautomerase family)